MNADDLLKDRLIGDMINYHTNIHGEAPSRFTCSMWLNMPIHRLRYTHTTMREANEKKKFL